jgi:hypothetical protein
MDGCEGAWFFNRCLLRPAGSKLMLAKELMRDAILVQLCQHNYPELMWRYV